MPPTVFIVDDDEDLLHLLTRKVAAMGYEVQTGATGADLNRLLTLKRCDALILDVNLPDADGIELLQEVHRHEQLLPVILATAHANVEKAVRAMKLGAYDFIVKPVDSTRLEILLKNAIGHYQLTRRVQDLETTLSGRKSFGEIIGANRQMQVIYSVIENVSQSDATVLITGESGTGKELVARAVHRLSPRSKVDMVDLNCAAIPDALLESELFGYEKGAFTGAVQRYIGCCERSHQSTLFLDEICDMSFAIQSKLLRFTQERTFYRLGGRERIQVDCRIMAATNREPLKEVHENRFREDLYYRINVVPIHLPPLRERKDDIPMLAEHFLRKHNTQNRKEFESFGDEAMVALYQYDWPGNVRELENAIAQAVVLHRGTQITLEMIAPHIRDQVRLNAGNSGPVTIAGSISAQLPSELPPVPAPPANSSQPIKPMWQREKEAIEEALRASNGKIAATCNHLQMSRATLYRKLKKYGIRRATSVE
ncbi:MAG: sigma-54 dependent transcriptional regulator [bacterium]